MSRLVIPTSICDPVNLDRHPLCRRHSEPSAYRHCHDSFREHHLHQPAFFVCMEAIVL